MGCTYTIAQGDTLPAIAARFGFADWNTIYNLPENASSRDLRPNPNLLHPGHELYFRIGRTANSPGRPTSCTSSFATGVHKCYACPGHPPNLTRRYAVGWNTIAEKHPDETVRDRAREVQTEIVARIAGHR
jgi:hypothetical protein